MKINILVRLKNPIFWVQVVGSFLLCVLAYNNMQPQDLSTWVGLGNLLLGVIKNPFLLVTCLWNVWSTINDPTVKGLSDSKEAMCYICPKEGKKNEN